MTKKLLLPLVDGGITSIETDTGGWSGCETCDYGSSYINYYTIYMTQGTIQIETDQEYSYALTEGYMMELILSNVDDIKKMTEQEFFDWLEVKLRDEVGEYSLKECRLYKGQED